MIEIQARLPRGNIYLAGESIECIVTFKNSIQSPKNSVEFNSIEGENLAWASVQIHCHCSVDETKVKFPNSSNVAKEEFATASEDTSFIPCRGERGHVVLSTKPKILFCDMRLMPGESKSFIYRDTIIGDCPPSFRGQAVRYAYKLTIGTQRVNTAIKLLRIPIRVFVLTGLSDVPYYNESEEFQVAPSNPFCQTQQKDSPLDLALQLLENATARRTPSFYNITNQNGRVVRFCLLKSAYRLGEDVLGTFDFTTATVPCVQFSVTLQSEEEISDECKVRPKQSFSTLSYSKYHEFCLHLSHTQMVLPIPLTATPAFTTNIVSLRWRLHFEFVTAASINGEMLNKPSSVEESEGVTWQGPANLDIQTMVWDLPIKIYATHPLQVAQGSLNQNFSTLVI